MTGFNAQVQVNGEWNRVRIGNFANRDAAMQAQSKSKGCRRLRGDWYVINQLILQVKCGDFFHDLYNLIII